MKDIYDCVVVGDVFIDIIVRGKNLSSSFIGGVSHCDSIDVFPGGCGNVAVGLTKLGGKSILIGKAGNDIFGKIYIWDLKRNGVLENVFFDDELGTGLIIDFVEEDGERSFLVYRGANNKLSPEELDGVSNLLEKSRYLYISGYSLVSSTQK